MPTANTHKEDAARKEAADKKQVTRMDPSEVQRQATIAASEADPDAPKPQVGISSSQLNTPTPAVMKQAQKHAESLPTNTDPKKGVSEAKASAAQKKLEKANEA